MNLKNWHWWRNKAINLQEIRIFLLNELLARGIETPQNISLILMSHALKKSKTWILAHGETIPSAAENEILEKSVQQLLQGVPLPYILGKWAFFGRTFRVTPDVLIPRPETELLVEKAICHAKTFLNPVIVDVGTGSGIIAISLATEVPSSTVIASDLSMPALKVAQANAKDLEQTKIQWVQADILAPFKTQFNLICANLPYIPRRKLNTLMVAQWEPRLALDGGDQGTQAIDALLQQAQKHLSSPGVILLEIEASLGKLVLASAKKAFKHAKIDLHQDLTGHDRLVEICQV